MNNYDPDCIYVGRKRCGCIVAFISGVASAESVAGAVSDWIREGLLIDRMTAAYVKENHIGFDRCEHEDAEVKS